ncbi:restriction endonuclease subunit S [Nitrosomonas marina]|uniref:Type I restriction enzyme, S subunit n=1 Tax=Nitrosomonas marina TaxID=917 RepID=A0A1H8HU21_9PROT|nr:restriction endonuclease subunit S [Nitrosomonas marina]SEN59633.1 type I restriction enzyme, S subunit [Nitrosomonas marina]
MTEQALQLGDCAKVISGYAFKSKDFVDEGIPVLKIANIKHEHVVFDGVQYLPPDFLNIDDKFKVKFGDVMICLTGSHISQPNSVVGRVAMYRHERLALLNQRAGRIVVNDTERLDKDFLYYFLRQERVMHDLALNAGGAANQANISPKDVERIELPDIDVLTQKSISSTLKAYDDLIENNKRRIELLEESARQLYKEWFVRFRFPGHEHVKIIDSVPEGWERCVASEALFINPKTPIEKDKEITYVPMASLSESQMTVDVSMFEKRTKHTTVKFAAGDTLFARITPCLENGKTAFVNFLNENEVACGSTEFIVLRGSKVSNQFAYLLAREESFRGNAIKSMIGSSGRQRVQPSCFDKYVVPVPPASIQEQFDEVVVGVFEQINILLKQTQQLATARDLLLPKLMSGEIAV